MNLYKLLYFLFFLVALHLHSEEGEASFDVIITCEGSISVEISVSDIDKEFTPQSVAEYDESQKNVLIGSFNVIVIATTLEPFTLSSYSAPAYVDSNNQFQALSQIPGINPTKLFYFGNKNKDGGLSTTELFNNSIIIENYSSTIPQELSLTIEVFMLSRQLLQKIGHTSFMPLQFNLAGA
jgi:hypothetical protein